MRVLDHVFHVFHISGWSAGFRPEKLVVDEVNGFVFYTDSQAGAIYRMELDGANHDYIISGVGRCTGLVLDVPNG